MLRICRFHSFLLILVILQSVFFSPILFVMFNRLCAMQSFEKLEFVSLFVILHKASFG